jgi:hypothetical protein
MNIHALMHTQLLTRPAQNMSHKITRFNAETEATQNSSARMLQEYPWIAAESQFFGKAHTDFDFNEKVVFMCVAFVFVCVHLCLFVCICVCLCALFFPLCLVFCQSLTLSLSLSLSLSVRRVSPAPPYI